jgi:succinyl-diaminopimelate desuccinylase
MSFDRVKAWIEARAEEMVELQQELTSRPAIGPENGGDGEWEKARFLEDYLRRHGLQEVRHYDCPDERVSEGTRPNMAVTVPGRREGPRLWVLTHLDVVPPGEQLPDGSWKGWDSDPFTVRRVGDMIVGRGVSDNQQALVSSVFAARALVENELKPANPVGLLFASDEETGSRYGLFHVLGEHGQEFSREDGVIVPDWGQPDGAAIEIAEKSVLWLDFRITGHQAHGSRPDLGVNAFRAGAWLVQMLDEGLKEAFDKVDHLYDVPASSFEPTAHKATVPNVNTIPPEDAFCFDCRVLPHYGLDAVLAFVNAQCRRVDGMFGTETEATVRNRQDAPPSTSPNAPVVELLAEAIRTVRDVEPTTVGIGGMTVAAPFREKGFPAAVWMTSTQTAHQVNEVCQIGDMVADAQVFACAFLNGL